MPTPFTHLAYAQHLLADEMLPEDAHGLIHAELAAFLLGSIAADAQTISSIAREETHFYAYDREMDDHPYRVMLSRYSELAHPNNAAQRAFIGGYVAHLGMDEIWTLEMTRPHFAQREWASRSQRFLSLHLLLVTMDERDERLLQPTIATALAQAQPDHWLPFIPDSLLCEWQSMIQRQIAPGGVSETLDVISPRVLKDQQTLRGLLDSPEIMERDLWQHIPPELLKQVETDMLTTAREQLLKYLRED
jgi:hypothetical protein